MKDGVMIINTSRGGLIDSQAAIEALKTQKIGALGMDVYENERDLFFEDKSNDVIQDDVFRRLSACHNVLFTGHQAFLTAEALISISETTLGNCSSWKRAKRALTNWRKLPGGGYAPPGVLSVSQVRCAKHHHSRTAPAQSRSGR
jgi:D-lactate dehydrogenase